MISEIYSLSKDYKLLYDLIQLGHRVPAWIVYTDRFGKDNTIYDLVEVKLSYQSKNYSIGTRGIGYGMSDVSYEEFQKDCEFLDLKFIVPNSK